VSGEYDYIAGEAEARKEKKGRKRGTVMSAVHFGANPQCIKGKKKQNAGLHKKRRRKATRDDIEKRQ